MTKEENMEVKIFQVEPTERQKSLPNTEKMSLYLAEIRKVFDIEGSDPIFKDYIAAKNIWQELTPDERERSFVYFVPSRELLIWLMS